MLVDTNSGSSEEPIGNGFFGKYLKKHMEMKKKAEAQIQEEDKEAREAKERMVKAMSDKIKADPVVYYSNGEQAVQKPKKKLSLSERAQ